MRMSHSMPSGSGSGGKCLAVLGPNGLAYRTDHFFFRVEDAADFRYVLQLATKYYRFEALHRMWELALDFVWCYVEEVISSSSANPGSSIDFVICSGVSQELTASREWPRKVLQKLRSNYNARYPRTEAAAYLKTKAESS